MKPNRRRLRTALRVGAVTLLAALIFVVARKPAPQPLESLAAFVKSHGTAHKIHPAVAKFFSLPADGDVFRECAAVSESGRKRSIGIRHRSDADVVDILLTDERPDGGEVYVYRTSNTGQLLSSALMDAESKPIDDARNRFDNEIGFWLNWQRETIEHAN